MKSENWSKRAPASEVEVSRLVMTPSIRSLLLARGSPGGYIIWEMAPAEDYRDIDMKSPGAEARRGLRLGTFLLALWRTPALSS